jgi:hypothetical protein
MNILWPALSTLTAMPVKVESEDEVNDAEMSEKVESDDEVNDFKKVKTEEIVQKSKTTTKTIINLTEKFINTIKEIEDHFATSLEDEPAVPDPVLEHMHASLLKRMQGPQENYRNQVYPPAPEVMLLDNSRMGVVDFDPTGYPDGEIIFLKVVACLESLVPKKIPSQDDKPEGIERVAKGRNGRTILNLHTHENKKRGRSRERHIIVVLREWLTWCMRCKALRAMLEPLVTQGQRRVRLSSVVCIMPVATSMKGVPQQKLHKDVEQSGDMISMIISTSGVALRTVVAASEKGVDKCNLFQANSRVFALDVAWMHAGPAEQVPGDFCFRDDGRTLKKFIGETRFMISFVRVSMPREQLELMLENDGGSADEEIWIPLS